MQYDFPRAECLGGLVRDIAGEQAFFGNLILNTSSSSCPNGVGIEGSLGSPGWPGAFSVGNNSALLEALQGPETFPGFSVELWLNIGDIACVGDDGSHSCVAPIFTIGSSSSALDSTQLCTLNTDMEIIYLVNNRRFEARFKGDYDCEGYGTRSYALPIAKRGYPFHFVFTIEVIELLGRDYSLFGWYINGTRVQVNLSSTQPPATLLAQWHAAYNLQLLDRSRQAQSAFYTPFAATIYSAALHNETFDSTKALASMAAGLANSVSVVFDTKVNVAEDGEAGNHYEYPEYYLEEFPAAELQLISLGVHDADNSATSNPNFDNVFPRVYIDTLPFPGSLVNVTGEDIVSTPFEVVEDGGEFPVRYRPVFNDFSTGDAVYANFSFHANDGATGIRSLENATMSLCVSPKNDPPVAVNLSHVAYAGTKQNVILLQGTDIDANDYVQGAAIVETPKRGSLFQVWRWILTFTGFANVPLFDYYYDTSILGTV